jgi:CTP synthase
LIGESRSYTEADSSDKPANDRELTIIERHRHRYEVNLAFREAIERGGLTISGTSPNGKLVEFVESCQAKFFVATQAHPEFRSRPTRPHPLFAAFINALK